MRSLLDESRLFHFVKWMLFCFLLTYLLLRVFLLEPLHDEVATYMFYFYQGDFWGETIQWDANNHLLNSFIGYILHRIFGDNFPILRLPNVIAFVFYFWATVRLTSVFSVRYLKITALVALNTIPFMMEYFAYARGYGLSLAFFAWALVYALNHLKNYSLWSLFMAYACLVFAISANLTFISTGLMIWLILLLYPRMDKKILRKRTSFKEWALHLLFPLTLLPFIQFGFLLKQKGALYYGRLDGIWDVTGKTLGKYVLFYDADWLRFLFLGFFAVVLVALIQLLRKISWQKWLQQALFFYVFLFFGNLFAALLMAYLLGVNYPEDRTGMYLIPLFLLMCFWLIEIFPKGKFLQVLFLFFPITLIAHLSLETSVFSPQDRLNHSFYQKVKREIQPEHSIMSYHMFNWVWPYQESHAEQKASVAQFDNPNSTLTDILITKTNSIKNPAILKLYDTIAIHPPSTHIALKRKKSIPKTLLKETDTVNASGNLLFADIAQLSTQSFIGKDIQLSISGSLKTFALKNKIQLVVATETDNGSKGRYHYYSFETVYQEQLIDEEFLHHFVLENIRSEETKIKVYIWNRALHLIELSNTKCSVFELKEEK